MFATDDTIVAIATPAGRGGLGVVRLSGPDAARIAAELTGRTTPLVPRQAAFAKVSPRQSASSNDRASGGPSVRDHVVVTFFPAPRSYTGDDVVEISAHGSPVVLRGIVEAAIERGARLAEPGEFTLRAFLNGRMDLVQAEAVADLIDAVTPLQARAAFDQLEGTLTTRIAEIERPLFDLIARLEASLDFPDEGYHFVEREHAVRETAARRGEIARLLADARRGRMIREGAQVAIIGSPNVGKSSLFNALVNANRAIVTPIPGTTRDLLVERADIGGVPLTLVDTAGIRSASDLVEREGVSRARQAGQVADLVLLVLDVSRPLDEEDRRLIAEADGRPRVVVVNKIDLPPAWEAARTVPGATGVSARTGAGLDTLVARMAETLGGSEADRDHPLVSNLRHITLLERADAALARALDSLNQQDVSEEFVLADLQEAASALQEITGRRTTDDLLGHIFARFCVGK